MEEITLSNSEEYRPIPIPRKGEFIAWMLSALGASGWLYLFYVGFQIHPGLKWITLLIAISAFLISISNWVDRNTCLLLKPEGVFYKNGLRKTYLIWEDIQRMDVIPSNWGNQVRVIGKNDFFYFRTLGEVSLRNRTHLKMGFENGEQILKQIIKKAQLKKSNHLDEVYDTYSK